MPSGQRACGRSEERNVAESLRDEGGGAVEGTLSPRQSQSVAGQGAQARLALAQLFTCQKGIIRVATS